MYLQTPGSIKRVIKDLYTVYLPPTPPRHQIIGHELKKSDQFWKRTPLPKYYEERRGEEKYRQDKEMELVNEGVLPRIKHFDKALESYRRQEWARRIYGVHFMNNGKPVYLTGAHYYFLQWCKTDFPDNDGYPLFYEPQLERFYFRQLCWEDPFSLGYMFVGPRGGGKTLEEVAVQLESMTRPGHNRFAAIQSKNEEEAKTVILQEKMVPMFNALPDFFKPEYSHGTEPKEKLIFKRPSKKGKDAKKVRHGEDFELGNTIIAYPPQNKSLDGKTLSDVIVDEIGKLKPEANQDAYERHHVNTRTVFRNRRKVGLLRCTTTVEEMEQGGDECFDIWQESDPRVRDQNGYTVSKIYKYFISAVETQVDLADKYGRIDPDKAYRQIMNEREPVKHDNYKLSLLMRKNPTTEEEAFIKDQGKAPYDVMILSKRISELKMMKPQNRPGRTYMIEWVNGVVDGNVELVPHSEGPLRLFYDPDEYWTKDRKLLNACQYYTKDDGTKIWLPCNNDLFRASCDPIKFVKTDDARASKMAGHGMMMYIPDLDNGKPVDEWISKNILWEYHARHTDPEIDFENMIKLMRYFGHSIMPEFNTGEFVKHLVGRGYHKFIIVRKQFDPTILLSKHTKNSLGGDQPVHSNTETIESYVKRTAAFIRRHGHRINSLALLEQLNSFDPKKPTKFDLAVSFGYGILAVEADLDDYFTQSQVNAQVMEYFPKFDISGSQSRMIHALGNNNDDPNGHEYSDFDDPNFLNHFLRS